MNSKEAASLGKAKEYAFLLLKFRLRSEDELYRRLKRKKFDERSIKKVIAFLKEKRFINDEEFAQSWIASRINRPLGLRRLRQELDLKGVARNIIDAQIEKIKTNYSEEATVLKLAKTRLNKLKDIEPLKAKRRIFAYLMRRGFSAEIIIDVINQL